MERDNLTQKHVEAEGGKREKREGETDRRRMVFLVSVIS